MWSCTDGASCLGFAWLPGVAELEAVGGLSLRSKGDVFAELAYSVAECQSGCAEACTSQGALEGDDHGRGCFALSLGSGGEPAWLLSGGEFWVCDGEAVLHILGCGVGGDVVCQHPGPPVIESGSLCGHQCVRRLSDDVEEWGVRRRWGVWGCGEDGRLA